MVQVGEGEKGPRQGGWWWGEEETEEAYRDLPHCVSECRGFKEAHQERLPPPPLWWRNCPVQTGKCRVFGERCEGPS